jgi:hypothetical protein
VVQSDPDPLDTFDRWANGHPSCPEFVGLSRSDAIEAARARGLAESMRILDLGPGHGIQRWHMDLRPTRLNIVVQEGTVVAAALF